MTVSSPENQVHLAVAGVGLALRGDGAYRVVLRLARYQPFLTAGPPAATIDVTTAEVNRDKARDPEVAWDGQSLFFHIYRGKGYLDVSTGTGWLQISADKGVVHPILANFLRVAYAVLLVRHGGFLFHSAGMIRNGQGYLFYGHSGSGKSTVSRLSQRHATLLSDDLVALRKHDDIWRVYGTPFWGDLEDHPKTNASAPLRGLFSLVKDTQVKLKSLPPSLAVADAVSSVPVTCAEPHLSAQLIDLCTDLVTQVPCYRLHFVPDDSFWNVIDELELT